MSVRDAADHPHFDGACLCKSIRFRIVAPSKWCAHCHCSMCQRAHGAAFVTWVGVEATQLELRSSDKLRWFASSPEASRGFCDQCGSSIFFKSMRWPGEMHIARACIPGAIDLEPSAHVFTATAAAWYHGTDELPRKE